MANASINGVDCPVCGEGVSVRANVDPGQPPSGLSGPPEFSDPGYGPSLDEVTDVEYNCDCRENIEMNGPSYKKVKTTFIHKNEKVSTEDGKLSHYIHWTAQERVKDDEGNLVYITVFPLLEAYDEAVEDAINEGEFEFDPYEPDDFYYED